MESMGVGYVFIQVFKWEKAMYSWLEKMPELRDHNTTVQIGETAKNNEQSILGIKEPSPVVDLPNFDLINGVVPDYMQCVLLRVFCQIATLCFD